MHYTVYILCIRTTIFVIDICKLLTNNIYVFVFHIVCFPTCFSLNKPTLGGGGGLNEKRKNNT